MGMRVGRLRLFPEPDEYPVKSGQQIAWSGNTGYSFRSASSFGYDLKRNREDYIDPMPFFKFKNKGYTCSES